MNCFRTIYAADIMSQGVRSVAPELSLRDAARQMCDAHGHCLFVKPDEPIRGYGIITCRDIAQLAGQNDASIFDELLVADAMTTPVISVQARLNVADCVNLMQMTGVRRVLVLKDTEAVGVLRLADVLTRISAI